MKVLVLFVFTLLLLSCSQNKEHSKEEFLFNDGKHDVYIVRGEDKHQVFKRDSSGTIAIEYWVNDKHQKNGKYTEYHPNGALKRKVNVVADLKHGEFYEFYLDGTIGINGSYFLGKMDGKFSFYKEDGNLYAIEIYDKGKKIVREFLEESEQVHVTIFPYIAHTPETPKLNDSLTISVYFSGQAIKSLKRPMEGYVVYDLIHIDSPKIPNKLDPPEYIYELNENNLDIIYIIDYCSPNALFYGYTFFVDTISKDTIEMEDFFEIITMDCIDL